MTFHRDLIEDDIHSISAKTYVDITTRDADTSFLIPTNISKLVRIDNPSSYYILVSVNPLIWVELSNTGQDSFIKLLDVPSSYAAAGTSVIQVNAARTGLEFGQQLRTSDSPEFVDLELTGDLIVDGNVAQLAVDFLFVGDKNIEIGDVDIPTDLTADGGGLTLHGDTDKIIQWLNSIDAWQFNRSVDVIGNITLTGLVDGIDIATEVPPNTTHRISDGSDHTFIDQAVTIAASPTFNSLVLTGDLTVQGITTTLDATTLLVKDKNIEIGVVAVPTDVTADGGGITLKGTTDKTINWINATNRWTFNQGIDLLGNNLVSTGLVSADVISGNIILTTGNLQLSGNTLSSLNGDIDIATDTGGVFKFESNALRVGQSAIDYMELGHNGNNSFISAVGAGGLIFAIDGAGRAEFTEDGHWHLKPFINQKDILKLKTSTSGTGETGLAWQNSIVGYTQTIYRKDIGGNRADLHFAGGLNNDIDLLTDSFKIHGGSGVEGKLEILNALQISSGSPASGKVLTSNVDGLASWVLPAGGGWTDSGTNVILTTIIDKVGIGESGPDTKLHVADGGIAGAVTPFAGTIATFESPGDGYISLLTPNANRRGILFGEPSSNIAGGIIFNNGGNAGLDFQFGGTTKAAFTPAGHLHLLTDTDQKHNLKIKTANNANDSGIAWENSGGNFSQTIFRSDVGSNRSDLIFAIGSNADIDLLANSFKIHGSAANEGRLEVLSAFQISSGVLGLNKVLTSDAAGIATWEDPTGNIIVQETFVSTNARFFGELQLPSTQGWTDVELINGTITVFADSVFGISQDVIKYDVPASGDTVESKLSVSAADWTNILTFGASYSGICRITKDIDTQSIFSGIGFSAGNDPRTASSIQSRVGVFISVDATHTTIRLEGQPVVILDGTSGNPLVLKDEWFAWEIFIDQTPDSGTSFGAVTLYVNGTLLVVSSIAASNTAVNDVVDVQNSSGSGSTTFYFANFGVTIYEESSTKTLAAATMVADVAQINIPEGRRDYTIILPDGNPRDIGDVLRLVSNNVSGSITLKNQNPNTPEMLYNGLRELIINIFVKEVIEGINTVNNSNVYVGFQTKDIDRTPTIFAQLNSSVNQEPADTNPTVITYNTQDDINSIKHSTTINPGELEILPGFEGVYVISPQPQVGKSSGGVKEDFDMFLQVDRGSGFVDEPNSNIKLSVKDPDETDVIVSVITIALNAGDKIQMMQKVSNSAVGMGLKNTDPVVGPPSIPRTPSIIFTMFRKGGLSS